MRYRADQKDDARTRLLAAAGRGFRRQGYAGIGVDGLAKEAGVTSGAFYGHFKSKDAAFAEAALTGLEQLREGIAGFQADLGKAWADAFIDFYLSDRLQCDLDESCALQSMTPDVMRADEGTKERYEAALNEVADQIAVGLEGGTKVARSQTAWALMALLSGGVTIARSTVSPAVRDRVANDLKRAAHTMIAINRS